MINDKDLDAIAKIIKGALRETRWIPLLVNPLADYFKNEYDIDTSAEPVISTVKVDPDCGPQVSITHHLKEADEATERWPEVIGKRKIK